MKKCNINMYKDGNRLVLVFEDCTTELENVVKTLIDAAATNVVGIEPSATVDEAIPVIPNKEDSTNQAVFDYGEFKGRSPKQIVSLKGDDGFIYLYNEFSALSDDKLKEASRIACHEYAKVMNTRDFDKADFGEITDFFTKYKAGEVTEVIALTKQVLEQSGYSSINDFMAFEPIETQREAYKAVVQGLASSIS